MSTADMIPTLRALRRRLKVTGIKCGPALLSPARCANCSNMGTLYLIDLNILAKPGGAPIGGAAAILCDACRADPAMVAAGAWMTVAKSMGHHTATG
jgi:hypothetical protein